MAFHNDERFIASAIESVLVQTFRDFELVMVDDASTDRSAAIAASYSDPRIRVIRNSTNEGLTRSLNRGLSTIRSEYVARLDANDVAFPTRLARQVAWLDQHPDVAALGVQAIPIDVLGRTLRRVALLDAQWKRPTGGPWMEWYRIFDTPFVHSAVMFRRATVNEVGGYDERHPLAQDAELWMRLGRSWRLANTSEALVAFRVDSSSMTGDPSRRERRGYVPLKTAIVHSLMRDVLDWSDVPERWAELWVRANAPAAELTDSEVRELATVLDVCAERFFERHPEARTQPEIAKHRASMLARLLGHADVRTMPALLARLLRLDARTATLVLPRLALRRVLQG